MAAAIHNFFIEQGSSFQITFEYLNSNNTPVDLSNRCVRLRMKDNNNLVRLYTSSVGCDNYSLVKSSSGAIVWTLSSLSTRNFIFDFANYDLDITDPSTDDSLRIATGRIEIIKTNFPECVAGNDNKVCSACESISCQDSDGFSLFPTATPAPTGGGTGVGPTPTPTIENPCNIIQENLCGYLCQNMDMFGKLYSGDQLIIADNSTVSGTISVSDTGVITNVELAINNLKHTSHQDISMILVPPSGNKILLSSHSKINNYNNANGSSFAFSNRAFPGTYLNNRSSDFYVNIFDKTNIYRYSSNNISDDVLTANLTDLVGHSCSGNWTLIIKDDDIGGSGSISGWNLVLTYEPPPYVE